MSYCRRVHVVLVAGVLAGSATSSASAPAAGPPSLVFKPGSNLCKTTSLAALKKIAGLGSLVGGDAGATGNFVGERRQEVRLAYHAGGTGGGRDVPAVLWRNPEADRNDLSVPRPPLARQHAEGLEAVLSGSPQAQGGSNRVALYDVYPKGIVQVVMAGPGTFLGAPTQQLIAVLRLVTHKE